MAALGKRLPAHKETHMNWLAKIRPQVLLIVVVLGTGLGLGLAWDYQEVAMACVVALAGAMGKLIEGDS